MNAPEKQHILIVVSEITHLEQWVQFAMGLRPDQGEVYIRGLVTIPPDKSLSEGALRARQLREAFEQITRSYPVVHTLADVRVDYRPLGTVINDLPNYPAVDLLLLEWQGVDALTGGLTTREILQYVPCDVALLQPQFWDDPGALLLSLRGGTNLSLGVRVATALAQHQPVTLFHSAEKPRDVPDLHMLMEPDTHITRVVTSIGKITETIVQESHGHKAIIMGAGFHQLETAADTVLELVSRAVDVPMVVVRAWQPEEMAFHAPRYVHNQQENLSTRVDRWFAENTYHSYEFADLKTLLALKEQQGVTISVGLPALNEAATIEHVIMTLKTTCMGDVPLVDEIVVIDSNSTDETVAIAENCGVPVYRHPEILPETGTYRGKGEALWKSLHVLKGDILLWVDTDIVNIHPRFVYGLVGPLLKNPQLQYVKSYFQRPIKVGQEMQSSGGGRVTELTARPLLNLFYPELSGVIQPLSGQYAGRRTAFEQMPFFTGYGVETGLLIDMHEHFGLDSLAQVDLEELVHHNQPLAGLSKMAFAILQVFIKRLEKRHNLALMSKASRHLKLVTQMPDYFALEALEIEDFERPPMITIPGYEAHR